MEPRPLGDDPRELPHRELGPLVAKQRQRDPLPTDVRERVGLPLLRDERPELVVRELSRIVAERAGLAPDTTADDRAEAGLDVAPGDPIERPIGFQPGVRR